MQGKAGLGHGGQWMWGPSTCTNKHTYIHTQTDTLIHSHIHTLAGEKGCHDLNSNLLLISSTVMQFSRNQEPCCATDREQVEAITTFWL